MKITIEAEPKEISELLQAITSSEEQTEIFLDSKKVANACSRRIDSQRKKSLGSIKQVGDSLFVNGKQIENILGGSISSEKTLDHVLVTCTIVGETLEIIPKRS